MSKLHVMLDLETAGVEPNAPVLSIGALAFVVDQDKSLTEVGTFHEGVNLQEQLDAGAVIGASTFLWWLQQEDPARRKLLALQKKAQTPVAAVDNFNRFCENAASAVQAEDFSMWGNGAAFDNTLLRALFARTSIKPAWPFWQDKCYRTLKGLAPEVELRRLGTHHDALDDARSQAHHLIAVCTKLSIEL